MVNVNRPIDIMLFWLAGEFKTEAKPNLSKGFYQIKKNKKENNYTINKLSENETIVLISESEKVKLLETVLSKDFVNN